MQITITEALKKLKTLDSRIEKRISTLTVVGVKRENSEMFLDGVTNSDTFATETVANYQSVTDLMKQRSAMKTAIAISNATTKVTIGGIEYLVTEVIDKKNSIQLEKELLNRLKRNLSNAVTSVQNINSEAEEKANRNVDLVLGNDKSKTKVEEIQKLYEEVYNANKGVLVDPLGVSKLIYSKELELETFLDEVDTQLVISNSTTTISI